MPASATMAWLATCRPRHWWPLTGRWTGSAVRGSTTAGRRTRWRSPIVARCSRKKGPAACAWPCTLSAEAAPGNSPELVAMLRARPPGRRL